MKNFGISQVGHTCSMREISQVKVNILTNDEYKEEDFMKEIDAYKRKYPYNLFKTLLYNTTFHKEYRDKLKSKFGFKEIGSYMGNHGTTVYIMQKNL